MNRTGYSASAKHGLHFAVILGWLLACTCAFAGTGGCEARALHSRQSIPARQLANWEPVDDHALLVWTRHDSRAHLVELDHPLPGLMDALTVVLATRDNDPIVCACGHDRVMVPGGGTARIISIRYLSEKRTAQMDPGGAGASGRARTTFT